MIAWLGAFAFTQCVEMPVYARALGGRWIAAFGASALTHPVVWFVIPRLWPGTYWGGVAAAEGFAVLAEGAYLRALGVGRPWHWAVVANAASAGLGLWSRAWFGWP